MAKIDHSTSFYQKMAELQEKLKRSEEERMKLEEKFTLMMKSCREEEEKRVRALRERYEKFLDDDKRRRDRNERILQTLEKIESRASALSAKSERLKLLRRHYEAYLVRMYPLWKKQANNTSQPSVPTNYPLSLPMETEKGLPWFGGSSGLFSNNMPLPSARSSLSPGSDQMWVPPISSRNIPMYDNSKQTIVHKPMERKNSVIESSSPAVEGALDNYLQRAAELLRVPIDELEGHSEKHDEEKSVHTEQDTSRDLLNVSLSDDSILFEKKTEKTRGNAVVNTKENVEKMIREEKYIPEIDQMAGGDNMISNMQSGIFQQKNVLNQPKVARSNPSAEEENMYNSSNNIGPNIPNINKNISEVQCTPSEQNMFPNNAYKNPEVQEDDEESLGASNLYNLQNISDKNLKFDNIDNNDSQELCASAVQNENIDNTTADDAYESVQHPICDVQQPWNDQLNLTDPANESPKDVENLHYAQEQESTNEQECSQNVGQNKSDFLHQNVNIPQECIESKDDIALVTKSDEKEQPTVTIDESQLENYEQNEECAGLQYSDNNENYGSQNTGDIEQCKQDCLQNSDLQYEQYPINTQYEQEQYFGHKEQPYNQQYPEQYSREQYVENSEQLGEEFVENDENRDQYGASNEGHLIDANPHLQNNHNVEEENISEEQVYIQNEGQINSTDPERESQEHIATSQLASYEGTEGGDLVETYQEECEKIIQKANVDDQECIPQDYEPKQEINDLDQILENQVVVMSNEIPEESMEHVEKESNDQDQQSLDVNIVEQVLAKPNNPSAIDDDSEESSTGFWNPPYHSSIPSVDELAPKAAIVVEDTSESSADSKMDPPLGKPSKPHNGQQFRSLLGVPSDPVGDSAPSDQDDVEDQLAALVEDPADRIPADVETKHDKTKVVKPTMSNQKVKEEKPVSVEQSKFQKDSKTSKSSESANPSTRTGLKKPPSLIKVLESDTESLNLNTGAASNVDSDEFDFSTE